MTGTSARENLGDIRRFVEKVATGKPDGFIICDVGAGQGTYWEALHDLPGVQMEAIEVWEESIYKFNLNEKYLFVTQADVRNLNAMHFAATDMIIFGDVLEHMTVAEAREVFMRAYDSGAWVVVSIPNSSYPQGAIDGNHYEEHIILDPMQDLIPLLPQPAEVVWEYPVTNTLIYKRREEAVDAPGQDS